MRSGASDWEQEAVQRRWSAARFELCEGFSKKRRTICRRMLASLTARRVLAMAVSMVESGESHQGHAARSLRSVFPDFIRSIRPATADEFLNEFDGFVRARKEGKARLSYCFHFVVFAVIIHTVDSGKAAPSRQCRR